MVIVIALTAIPVPLCRAQGAILDGRAPPLNDIIAYAILTLGVVHRRVPRLSRIHRLDP